MITITPLRSSSAIFWWFIFLVAVFRVIHDRSHISGLRAIDDYCSRNNRTCILHLGVQFFSCMNNNDFYFLEQVFAAPIFSIIIVHFLLHFRFLISWAAQFYWVFYWCWLKIFFTYNTWNRASQTINCQRIIYMSCIVLIFFTLMLLSSQCSFWYVTWVLS